MGFKSFTRISFSLAFCIIASSHPIKNFDTVVGSVLLFDLIQDGANGAGKDARMPSLPNEAASVVPTQTRPLLVLLWITFTIVGSFHLIQLYAARHLDAVRSRSPWLLGVGVISGWAALSAITFVVGSGFYDREPLAPVSLYIWTMHFAVPMTTLPHVLRAFRLSCICDRQKVTRGLQHHSVIDTGVSFRATLHELERRANALSQRSSETTLASALVCACAVAACNATFWQIAAANAAPTWAAFAAGWASNIALIILYIFGAARIAKCNEAFAIRAELRIIGTSFAWLQLCLLVLSPPWSFVRSTPPSASLIAPLMDIIASWLVLTLIISCAVTSFALHKEKIAALVGRQTTSSSANALETTLDSPLRRSDFGDFLSRIFHDELMPCYTDLSAFCSTFAVELRSETECAELPMPASASVRLEVAQTGEAPQCCDLAQAEVADRVVKMTISARNIWNKYFKRAALMHVRFDSETVDEVAFRLDSNNATACMFMGAKEEVLAHMRSLHTLFVVDALMTVALPKAVLA